MAVNPLHTCAQLIVPATDKPQTQLIQNNWQITMNGGLRSLNGRNLPHGLTEVALTSGQNTTFLSHPTIGQR